MEEIPKTETNSLDSSRSLLEKSSESMAVYTRCVNDDSNGSIFSNWMDSDVEEQSPASSPATKFKELMQKTSEYLIQETEKEERGIREVNSEYAFDIQNY